MNIDEIIKACEICITNIKDCDDCPYEGKIHCEKKLFQDVLNLLNNIKGE